MKRVRHVPAETLKNQAEASDPQVSAWVSANAGSGKTHVLAQRVIRLLLDGVDPSRILCLTYTKAAAANMSNRVFRDLAAWTTMPDETLAAAIEAIEGRPPDRPKLLVARRLFARALETPGGLKIQTIHAFCEAILHQFPLEANIAGHFEMLDGRMEAALLAEARRDMLTAIAAREDERLVAAFERVLSIGGESGLDKLLAEVVARRDPLRALLARLDPDFADLYAQFGVLADEDVAALAEAACDDTYFTVNLAQAVAARGAAASMASPQKFAEDMLATLRIADPVVRLHAMRDVFTTKEKDGKGLASKKPDRIRTKALAAHFPDFDENFQRFAETLIATCDRIAVVRMLDATKAALTVADVLIGRYERLKAARGLLDFNDLITRTVTLLSRADVGPWVQYKLDRGIDHILVDEAQDTSPDQWIVVRQLAEEFFAGAGQRDNINRTIFAVGDEKQSIYSFQGADPASFGDSGAHFRSRVDSASGQFRSIKLQHSFRSTADVLASVDRVFATDPARQGLTRDPEPIRHPTVRTMDAGHVELWPLIDPQQVDEPDDWTKAIDHTSAPAVQLAERIAAVVDGWIRSGDALEGQPGEDGRARRVRAGDVLVLVRKRDRFVHALSRALKNRHVPVAGADRLSLPGHIAVKDLIAIGRVCLQPQDDLSLAALLRSPVFGLTDEQLFALAWNRGPRTLLSSLRSAAEADLLLAPVIAQLDRWADEAAFKPVFEFYAGLLGRDGVRRSMISRLGHAAGEVLDEFLNFALAAERTGLPGLEAFLATLEGSGPDIKREMDQTRDEVRIMTVHAAKGLEAPIVFLVDGGSRPFSDGHLPRLVPFKPRHHDWGGRGFLWRAAADIANPHLRAINAGIAEDAEKEYRRLLYVAMTRAEDRLIVCGYRGVRQPDPGIWHRLVEQGLAQAAETRTVPHPHGWGDIMRFRISPPGVVVMADHTTAPASEAAFDPLPPLPAGERPGRSLSPSGASALLEPPIEPLLPARSPVPDGEERPSFAIARGLAIHRLLQVLPTVAPDERPRACAAYLDAAGRDWRPEERAQAAASVLTVLDDPRFAAVFAPGSRAEVAVSGTLEIGGVPTQIAGTIDRLATSADRVLIVDYKTNRPPPVAVGEIPDAYVVQMALYRALIHRIFPGRNVGAALLFTETPALMELPAALMDAALERLTGA